MKKEEWKRGKLEEWEAAIQEFNHHTFHPSILPPFHS